MDNLVGVVNKPQFDINTFQSGTPIHLKQFALSNGHPLQNFYALVDSCTPLVIKVWAYNKSDNDFDQLEIDIKSVVGGEYEINLMMDAL